MLKKAFKASIPIKAGYLLLGAGFGIFAKAKGYGILWAVAMSVFVYGGSMQYVGIDLMSGGVSFFSTFLISIMVQARHLFYAISMIDKYSDLGKEKAYTIFSLTDETYSLVVSYEEEDKKKRGLFYFYISLLNQIYWIIGTCAGSILGDIIKFDTNGIDFAMTALFVTVFTEQWLSNKERIYAVIGVLSSVICLVIFGKSAFLIPTMLLIITIMSILYRRK